MCGDSTDATDVALLMAGANGIELVHADPPYGMGKQKDGVENDNLYRDKLDAFQFGWWETYRPYLANNASAYVWGNAEELWRFWFKKLAGSEEEIRVCNEIVWDKHSIPGMASDLMTQYAVASERCLFIQIGKQFIGNVNSDDFPKEWKPLLDYQKGEADAVGLDRARLEELIGVQMYSHWFSKSQFSIISEKHYETLKKTYPGHFMKPWNSLREEWNRAHRRLTSEFAEGRSFFDNAHDSMYDVWDFPRVIGEERWGHATPKPVEMIERCILSSCPKNGIVVEPFSGSGSTLIACEKTGRSCYTMELSPIYVDTTIQRWQQLTGLDAERESDGVKFDDL